MLPTRIGFTKAPSSEDNATAPDVVRQPQGSEDELDLEIGGDVARRAEDDRTPPAAHVDGARHNAEGAMRVGGW